MQRTTKRFGLAALAAVFLAGCAASGVTIYRTDVAQQYSPQTLGLIGSGKHDLQVDVGGNPFAVDEVALMAAVITGLEGRTGGIPVNFSGAPDNPYPRGNYRTVVVFNAPPSVSQWDVCRAADPAALSDPVASADLTVFAAYCEAELPLSWAAARATDVPGPQSERIDQLMAQMALAMFPSRNRHLTENCAPRIFPCP